MAKSSERMIRFVASIYENSFCLKSYFDALGASFDTLTKYFSELRALLRIKAAVHLPLNPAVLEKFARDNYGFDCCLDETHAGEITFEPGNRKFNCSRFASGLRCLSRKQSESPPSPKKSFTTAPARSAKFSTRRRATSRRLIRAAGLGLIDEQRGFDLLSKALAGKQLHFTRMALGDANGLMPTEDEQYEMTSMIHQCFEAKISDMRFTGGGGAVCRNVTLSIVIVVDKAKNVTAVIDASLLYVSQAEFLQHVNSDNPHPNLPNVAEAVTFADTIRVDVGDNKLHPMSFVNLQRLILNGDASAVPKINSRLVPWWSSQTIWRTRTT